MAITVLLGGPVYTGTVESESAARKVLQARAKAEDQSLEGEREFTSIILGYSFSEKRHKSLDFINYGMAWNILCLSFPDGQSDVNMLILVMGTATHRAL